MEPWHILVVTALSNARQLQPNQYVVHKIPARLYDGRTIAEFKKTLSLRFSSLIREEKKALPKGVDEASCVLSVHDADSLAKLFSADNVQEMASDRRLFRIVALVGQPVFELLRDIHGPIPEFSPEQLEEGLGSPVAAGRKRAAASAFGDSPAPNGGAMGLPDLPPGILPQQQQQHGFLPPQQQLQQQHPPALPAGQQEQQQQPQQQPQPQQQASAPWQAVGKDVRGKGAPAGQRGREERQPMMRQQQATAGAAQRGGGQPGRAEQQDRRAPAQPAGVALQPQPQPGPQGMPGAVAAPVAPGQGPYAIAAQQAGPLMQGYGGPVVPPPDVLQQQLLAEQQMLMDQHLMQQAHQAQQAPAGGAVPNLPPHLMQPGYHHPQQQALLSEQQAAMDMFQRQQAGQQAQQAQHPGYYPSYY